MPRDATAAAQQQEEFAEVDPTGRYGRYAEVLGKGAYKIVYKAFDELEGMEVAWNQVKVADVLRKSDDLDRLYSEVHLLQTLKHKNIIKCYSSWIDIERDNINFITEVFTSGNLREYRNKHKHVNLRALKSWSRQILQGLLYLHSHDPPVIHRDLKCDNIFVNGNQGEVKIGDLGLAAILYQAHAAHSVIGTPEFMAPELYEEEYNELVDIYAFGMCLLELVTFEYPYAECANAAQIFKRVSTGIKPASLTKVKDPEVKKFIEKCIAIVTERLSARELLNDPFLLDLHQESVDHSVHVRTMHEDGNPKSANVCDGPSDSIDLSSGRDFTVEGQRRDMQTIFLKLRIANSSGSVHDIHFPFDIEADTSISVASEMVAVLDLTDQDVTAIAAMIDSEIQCHIPNWISRETADEIYDDETADQILDSESKDEISALLTELDNASTGLVLDRLPSGHVYWSDSPLGSNEGSSLRQLIASLSHTDQGTAKSDLSMTCGNQDADSLINDAAYPGLEAQGQQGHIDAITNELEKLLIDQRMQMEELKKKHEALIEELLKDLPCNIRDETLRNCRLKVPIHSGVESKKRETEISCSSHQESHRSSLAQLNMDSTSTSS